MFHQPPQPELRNGLLLTYSVSYREYDPTVKNFRGWRHLRVSATREVSSVVLRNLNPSTKYGVMVQALTNAGIGPAATAPLCSTLDEGELRNAAHRSHLHPRWQFGFIT